MSIAVQSGPQLVTVCFNFRVQALFDIRCCAGSAGALYMRCAPWSSAARPNVGFRLRLCTNTRRSGWERRTQERLEALELLVERGVGPSLRPSSLRSE